MNGDPSSQLPGYMIELAQRAFDNVDYQQTTWVYALDDVRTGRADCIVGADINDVPGFVLPKESWGDTPINIYIKTGVDWQYEGLDSLFDKSVGVVQGYTYGNPLDGLIPKYPGVFKISKGMDGIERNIKQVMLGRLDAFIASDTVTQHLISKMQLKGELKNVGSVRESTPIYLACSPASDKSLKLVKLADQTIQRLRASGELTQILNKYGLSDWQ